MKNGHHERDLIDTLIDYAWIAFACIVVAFVLSTKSEYYYAVWKYIRIGELYFWHFITLPFGTDFFSYGIDTLKASDPKEITWDWILSFEAYFNKWLRFVYASFFFVIAAKIFHNYLTVTKRLDVQSMIELYRHESKAIEVLAYDNPLFHHQVYDFDNREDFHNRHAAAMQPNLYLTATPPPNATRAELEGYKKDVAAGRTPSIRSIATIDRKNKKHRFDRDIAKRSFERQLTNPPAMNPFYLSDENVPRLFDDNGQIIPLVRDEKGRIIGGFSTNKLLNNGREYRGSVADIALLFNGIERDIYFFLCERYCHPTISLDVVVMELTKQHAFTRTYLASMLNIARQHDTIASSEFYLLKRKDRVLFYTLYSASEEKPSWEAAGIMAHYHHEIELGSAISSPQVITAVDAIEREYRRLKQYEPDFKDLLSRIQYELSNEKLIQQGEQIDFGNVDGDFALINTSSTSASSVGEEAVSEHVRDEQ